MGKINSSGLIIFIALIVFLAFQKTSISYIAPTQDMEVGQVNTAAVVNAAASDPVPVVDKNNYVLIGGKKLKVDVADTEESREEGLSDRKSLGQDEGMLFIFEESGLYAFWMKDMNFSIDIIWISADNKIVYIQKNATPDSYPKAFSPGKQAKYVLEVATGFSDKNNLKEGDSMQLKLQ